MSIATGAKWIAAFAVIGTIGFAALPDAPTRESTKPGYPRVKDSSEEERGAYDEPEAFARMWEARREGTGELSPAQVNLRVNQTIAREALQRGGPAAVPAWGFEELGPGNFGGRSRGILVHATVAGRLLFSSVSGGLWRSENNGASWTPVADFIANLAVGSIAVDPDNADRVFIGTGEGFFNGDAARGAGIFVSEDFGLTWAQLPSTDNADFHWVNRIALVPGTNVLIAATRSGLWRSTDLGATFTRVATDLRVDNRGYTDIKRDPSNPQRLLASHFGSAGGRGPIPQVAIAGLPTIVGVQMGFGPATATAPLNALLVVVNDGVGTTTDACEALPAGSLAGRIVLIDRGSCAFTVKVTNAQNAGAAYVVIGQNVPDAPFAGAGTGTFTIASMMVSQADANTLKAAVSGNLPGVLFTDGFEPAGSGQVAAQVSGPQVLTNYLVRSTDAGATWTQLTAANGLPETNIGRSELGWGTGNVVYAAFSTSGDTTRGLWRSADAGQSWVQTASTTAFIERQGWYDLVVEVSPTDNNRVLMGAVDMFVTSDGGATITKNTFWNPGAGQIQNYVHADHHGYTYAPGGSTQVYTASDGGVQYSTNGGTTFRELNFGLNASMPNNISVSPNGRVVTGTQDNGSHLFIGSDQGVWLEWRGGDGGVTAADQQNSNFFYSANPQGDFFGTGDGGNSTVDLPLAVAGAAGNALFYAPIAIDPNNGDRLLVGVAGAQLSTNARLLGTSTWTPIVMPAAFGAFSNTLTISPLNGTVAYAGSTNGAVVRISGLGTTNTVTSIQGNLPLGSDVSQILVDRTDANRLYVVFADYGGNRVWETLDGGATWTSIHGTLPAIPMFAIEQVPGSAGDLIVGSELGLWYGARSANGVPTWTRFDNGIPLTRVTGIAVANNGLYFSVYGRSNFKATQSPLRLTLRDIRGDTGCDLDGDLDEGESATLPVAVRNLSNQPLGAILLSLSSSNPAITAAAQNLPSLAAGASATVNFTVAMATQTPPPAACPSPANLTVTAQVNSTSIAVARIYGVDQNRANLTTLTDGAEATASLFSATSTVGPDQWQRVSTQANTGTSSYFAANTNGYSEKLLTSPWLTVNSGTAGMSFAIRYDTEGDAVQRWDGVVLEARSRATVDAAAGPWIDIGGNSSVAYDGPLFNNTAVGPSRPAWSGTQTTWRTATVPLSQFNGSQLQFRFRFVSDQNTANVGFWLDDVAVTGVSLKGLPTCDASCN